MCWWPPRGACSTSTGRTPSVSPSCRRWCSTRRTACSTSVSLKNWMRCSPLCRESARPCCSPRPSPTPSARWPARCCATRCPSKSARATLRRRRSSSGWCRWTRSAKASCSCTCWRNGAGARFWYSSRRARASISWWTSCRRRASPATRSTATSRRPASARAGALQGWRGAGAGGDRRGGARTGHPRPAAGGQLDPPIVAEDYVHRIGRTGRAGASGEAISWSPLTRWTSWPPSRP